MTYIFNIEFVLSLYMHLVLLVHDACTSEYGISAEEISYFL